jgi:hypothetical protein
MADHGRVLRALADRTDWQGDDGERDAVYEAIDRIDPQVDDQADAGADTAGAKTAGKR